MEPVYGSRDKRQANSQYLCWGRRDFRERDSTQLCIHHQRLKGIRFRTGVMLSGMTYAEPMTQGNSSAETPR
jgi:hypothetical protein